MQTVGQDASHRCGVEVAVDGVDPVAHPPAFVVHREQPSVAQDAVGQGEGSLVEEDDIEPALTHDLGEHARQA